ncbi:MAG: Polysaccharide biosynthesis protein [Candidatus Roizmanbacteria bacterium GW2011_GWC2_37_13]|uniref:Polysaccharide biosynthesis protein n=1 Tax=Candidatus Roizmanbacteria bacterium GW2011_GWC2_37_13 TaxID=1618486 RepID=A0A0G0G737_9BACT|nr:MAG: Polysaccharide biosynthesis protein [Candidatus Roizmanbacteria bacterium GW2011_GWC1_37_12]KKQ25867.1 MAG: Polysaccharide biosynthesis protein [Candidatus Roizmanbacteria bacterium GW2011_GWC2_37_13]
MDDLKKKTIISTLSLFFQSGYSAILGFIANLVLTILLTPKIFGIYFTILSLIAIFNYFSDIGLAASLIQKKEIEDKEISTVFTVQQILVITIIIIGWLITPIVMVFYKLPIEGQYLYWALLISFFLSSLKTIPSIFLERKIQFQRIVLVQIVENTVFYLSVITLAIMGWGLNSFTAAVILRAILGLIIIYYLSPWKMTINIDLSSLKKLLTFGVPFQLSSFLALVKDDFMTLYLGKVLGFEVLGFLGWAKKWAESPIRIIMDSLSRVLFPLFSRFQADTQKLKNVVEKVIYYQSIVIIPATLGLALVMEKMIEFIPKYSKWSPAVPYFYLFCLSALLSSYSTPFINLLNGLGKTKTSLYFMIGWTAATWILVPILTFFFAGFGFPITLVALSCSFVLVVFTAKKTINFIFIENVLPFLLSSILMGLIVLLIFQLKIPPFQSLLISIFSGIISYLLTLKFLFKIDLFSEVKNLWKTFQP